MADNVANAVVFIGTAALILLKEYWQVKFTWVGEFIFWTWIALPFTFALASWMSTDTKKAERMYKLSVEKLQLENKKLEKDLEK